MLEPYTDDSLICIGLQMQQGYVGFFDLEQDTKYKDKYVFVLNSDCFNEWYKKDITELKEKIVEQQATISQLKEENEQLRNENERLRQLYEVLEKLDVKNKRLREENGQLKKEHKIAIDEMITDYLNLEKENEQLKEELNNLKKDETMLYHYYTLARYCGDGV